MPVHHARHEDAAAQPGRRLQQRGERDPPFEAVIGRITGQRIQVIERPAGLEHRQCVGAAPHVEQPRPGRALWRGGDGESHGPPSRVRARRTTSAIPSLSRSRHDRRWRRRTPARDRSARRRAGRCDGTPARSCPARAGRCGQRIRRLRDREHGGERAEHEAMRPVPAGDGDQRGNGGESARHRVTGAGGWRPRCTDNLVGEAGRCGKGETRPAAPRQVQPAGREEDSARGGSDAGGDSGGHDAIQAGGMPVRAFLNSAPV